MIKVKLRINKKRYSIPIPYVFLDCLGAILTSGLVLNLANKAIAKSGSTYRIPKLNKSDLKPLIKALAEQKGLLIVETKFLDGTEVSVRL